MPTKTFSFLDKLLLEADQALRTIFNAPAKAQRVNPSLDTPKPHLNQQDARLSAGLMRVDHTGEVCAQALYRGQAWAAKAIKTKQYLLKAAEEEKDHLLWCEERLTQLS